MQLFQRHLAAVHRPHAGTIARHGLGGRRACGRPGGLPDAWQRASPAARSFRMELPAPRRGRLPLDFDEGNPRRDADGAFVGYIGYCYDITERKRGDLRSMRSRYARLSGEAFTRPCAASSRRSIWTSPSSASCGGRAHIEVRAGWGEGAAIGPFLLCPCRLPCDGTIGWAPASTRGVHARFPRDRELVRMGIEAHAGMRQLFDRDGGVFGHCRCVAAPSTTRRRYAPLLRSSTTASRPSWRREGVERVLNGRIAFERLVGRISSDLISPRRPSFDLHLHRALGQLGASPRRIAPTCSRCPRTAPCSTTPTSGAPRASSRRSTSCSGLPSTTRCSSCARSQLEIVDYPSVVALPAEAEADRVLLERSRSFGARRADGQDGQVRGVIGLDAVQRAHRTDEDRTLMTQRAMPSAGHRAQARPRRPARRARALPLGGRERARGHLPALTGEGAGPFSTRRNDITGYALADSQAATRPRARGPSRPARRDEMTQRWRSNPASTRHDRCAGGGFRWLEMMARRAFAQGRPAGLPGR